MSPSLAKLPVPRLALGLDPELATLFASLPADGVAAPTIAPGDWQAQRLASTTFYDALAS